MDQRYYCQQRYGGDGGYMDGPPQYGQHMPRNAYKQPYNNYSRPNHNYNNYGKHNPVPVDTNNYYKQPHPSAPTHWQPMPQPQAPPPPAPPTFAPPPPPPAPVHSKSGKKDVVALIVENNNLKRMIVLHMSLLQEQTDKLEKKNKQLDERNLRIETLLAQKQELLQQVARLGHTVDELRCHRRRSNKRTAIEDVAPKPKVPCFVENQTQTEAMQQQVLVEQVQQVVEPSVVHHCYQPQPQPAPQRKPTQNVIVTSVTELPPTTPALEHIKGHGGFNGGKKFSTIILHRVHQESSSLQLQEEQEKQEHEQDDDADQLQIDEEIQTNMHEQHEVFLEEEEQLQLQNDGQHIYHDGMEGMTETVIGAEEELGAVEEMAEENINNGHMIEISDMGQVVGHIDIERLRRLGINCVKQSDREHQHPQQLHLYETPQSQLLQSSAEDDVVNALLQSQQSEIILQAEPIETANITEIPQKQKPSKYLAPIANACPEPVKKVRTFAKTRVNQVVRKLPTLENSKRIENVNANYKPHMLAKPVVVQDEEQKRQEAAAEEQKRQLEIQLKQEQEALEQKKREQQREFELQQQQEQERKQQMLMEEQLRKQREEQEQEEQRAKQKELERQQQLMQAQLRKQEEERQEQLKKQQQEQERQEQLKKQQELARQEQLKKQEQARQEEIRKKEQQQKRQEEAKQKKQEEHLKMLDLERSEKKKRIQEKKRKQLLEQKKQERDQKKKIEVQKIKERNKARQELLRIQNQKQESKLISEVQTEVVVKPIQHQPDSKVENQKPVEPQSEPIEEEEEDVEETIVRRLQEHLQKEQQRMQEHIQKEQQRLQSLQQQQPMVRLKRSPMDSNMGSNTSLIYPPLPQSASTTSTTTTMTSSSTMTPAPTPPPTNAVSPRLRGVKSNASTTTQTTTTTTVTAATEKATPTTPLTPQSASKRKRQQANKANNRNTSKFLTSLQPYTTRSWEDQEFHCDNEFFIEEADELLADNPSLEIPKWKVVKLPRCNDDKNIERLNNTVYELRHDKYVRDEIERKKRDARYNLEQNKIEALRQRHNQDEVLVPLPPLPTSTFYPLPEDIEGIQFVTEVPVQAFGENMLNPHTQDGHFSLPWLAATLAATAEERAKAAAMPVATLANKKLPTTKKESSHQELHSSYVFLKRRKRQQRR